MDAAHQIESTPDRGRLRMWLLRCVLPLVVVVCSASLSDAQTPINARQISPPNSTSEFTPDEGSNLHNGRSIYTTAVALGLILILFLGLVQLWRRFSPSSSQSLPSAAWEILGSAPLDAKHQMLVVRLGSRLLVLGRSDEGLQTLSEITSGDEVAQLVALCQSSQQSAETNSFRQMYENFRTQIGASKANGTASQPSAMQGENRRA